jgi:hypothetical protein
LDFRFWILEFGFWIGDFRFWIGEFGIWILDWGIWILDFGLGNLDFGFWIGECRDAIYRVSLFDISDWEIRNYELTNILGFAPKCSISNSRKTGCKSSQGTPLVTQVPKLASLPTLPPM